MPREHDVITLVFPRIFNRAQAEGVCEKTNNMMRRLGVRDHKLELYENRGILFYAWGGDGGCEVLETNSVTLNLDYLGRDRRPHHAQRS